MQAFDRTGAAQKLGNEIARGGEGSVFPVATRHSVVAKLYHPEVITRRGGELEDKVAAMTSLRGHFDASALAWPAIPVFGADGTWCGYAMRRAEGIPLSKVAHPILGPRYYRHWIAFTSRGCWSPLFARLAACMAQVSAWATSTPTISCTNTRPAR